MTTDSQTNQRPTVTAPSLHPDGTRGLVLDAIEDIRAVRRADPAARTPVEVVLTYPGLHALWFHRVAHRMFNRGQIVRARLLSHLARHYTGIEIHPGAQIGRRVFIDHGMGIVIGETAVIGDDCLIYKGVVLGGTTLARTKRHPTLGKGVTVGSNACILGAVEVGDGARIGSGSVVIKDVAEGATVVGIPGRVVSKDKPSGLTIPNLDHAALPDPLQRIVKDLIGAYRPALQPHSHPGEPARTQPRGARREARARRVARRSRSGILGSLRSRKLTVWRFARMR